MAGLPILEESASQFSQIVVERSDDRDLAFRGQLLGESFERSDFRGRVVRIYQTEAGAFVVSISTWTQWQGESGRERAEVVQDAEGVFHELCGEWSDQLFGAAKEAWEQACGKSAELAEHRREKVE
jgi:hypothetical protein